MPDVATLLATLNSPGAAAPGLRELDRAGLLSTVVPELEAGRGFVQPELHHYDVLDHNLATVAALDSVLGPGQPNEELRNAIGWLDIEASLTRTVGGIELILLLRLACLLHDVAKPATAVQEDGRLRFPRHGPVGSEMMRSRLQQLEMPSEATDLVCRLIRYHLRPRELVINWPVSDRAVRRFARDLDGNVLPLMLLNLCDGMAVRGPTYTRENFRRHCALVNYVVARCWNLEDHGEAPLLTGDDLITELDLESGRLLGAVLTSLRHAQSTGAISTRDEALALARSFLAAQRASAP